MENTTNATTVDLTAEMSDLDRKLSERSRLEAMLREANDQLAAEQAKVRESVVNQITKLEASNRDLIAVITSTNINISENNMKMAELRKKIGMTTEVQRGQKTPKSEHQKVQLADGRIVDRRNKHHPDSADYNPNDPTNPAYTYLPLGAKIVMQVAG